MRDPLILRTLTTQSHDSLIMNRKRKMVEIRWWYLFFGFEASSLIYFELFISIFIVACSTIEAWSIPYNFVDLRLAIKFSMVVHYNHSILYKLSKNLSNEPYLLEWNGLNPRNTKYSLITDHESFINNNFKYHWIRLVITFSLDCA